MAPPYLDSSPLSFPSDHDDLRYSDHFFFPTTPQASSSSSSLSFPLFPSDHGNNCDSSHLMELKREGGGIVPCNIGSCNNERTVGNDLAETGLRFTIWKQIDKSESSSCCENIDDSVKWASSKMRLVVNSSRTERETATQMINGGRSFQDLNRSSPSSDQTNKQRSRCSSLNDGGVIIRTCSDCNTTKTPLWRSGPRGPKSLCNACGIRQRKARRAMAAAAEEAAAAAAANNGAIPCGGKPAVPKTNKVQQQQHKVIKPAAVIRNIPQTTLKRKCKDVVVAAAAGGGRKKLCFEDITISSRLSESSSSYQRVFPQDEKEAAILLMTLSYGLLHG